MQTAISSVGQVERGTVVKVLDVIMAIAGSWQVLLLTSLVTYIVEMAWF